MFKSDNILLILLIGICLVVSVVLVDSVIDPSMLIHNVYARFSDSSDPLGDVSILPIIEEELALEFGEEGSTLLQDGWDFFRSEGFAFEIQYPKEVVRKSILNQDALNAGVGVNKEAPVWEFRLDNPALYQGTNLEDASLLIHVLEGKDQEAACAAFKPGSIYQTPNYQQDKLVKVDINGVSFWKDEVIEGVMGEFYQRISYRTFSNGACYELTQLIHYQNSAGFTGEEIAEFDKDQVIAELDQVLNTFSLLDLEPTFPEQSYPMPKTISAAVAKATSGNVDGLDVSHWQGTINWTKVANAGYVFTFAKGTEGVGWTDVKFHTNMNQGRDAGVLMGVYHFARPDLGNSGAAEANYFLSVVGDYLKSGYLRPVLDLEVGSSLGKTALSKWVLEWMQTVKNRTGIEPLIYTNPNFINYYLTDAVKEYDLWVAHWTCTPIPSYNIPNTGMWRDWAFWQYYGPGGCGGNAGYVPGITTNIDLNIFNGVEAGLSEYDALSHLWVSLSSDAYYVPAPYYADITGNVNGDTTGVINYAFWWDCDALGADISAVEGVCGVLPTPNPGACLKNAAGQRCTGVTNELQLAEHTYLEIGDYTAKVIVERGGAAPAEDRYKISTYNPIRTVTLNPISPAVGSVNNAFVLNGAVKIHTTLAGVLQLSVGDPVTGEAKAYKCVSVSGDVQTTKNFSLSFTESAGGELVYSVWTKYRPNGVCPIVDNHQNDSSQLYKIKWENVNPILELHDAEGLIIPSGGTDHLGDIEPFQTITQVYMLSNLSTAADLQVSAIVFENLENVLNPQAEPAGPITVGPGEEVFVTLSFEAQSTGGFSLDVVLEHDASNPTPYIFSVEGNSVLSENPIRSIAASPASPGESLQGTSYALTIDVDLDAPVTGVLQVNVVDQADTLVQDPICQAVPAAGQNIYSFDFAWSETGSGLMDYQIWTQYRDHGECPVVDSNDNDLSQGYQINWLEDSPVIEVETANGDPLPSGGKEDLGNQEPFQPLEAVFVIYNPSTTNDFQITSVDFENLVNVQNLVTTPSAPISVGPGEEIDLTLGFEIITNGEFSFDVNLNHNASNVNPYSFTLQGKGVLAANPIQSITPAPVSPAAILIGDTFQLKVDLTLNAPVSGGLQVGVNDLSGSPVQTVLCQDVSDLGSGLYTFDFSWSEAEIALQDYTIWAEFVDRESCPANGTPLTELSMSYQVDWQEDRPTLELLNADHSLVPAGETIGLGQYEYYQSVDLSYLLHNTSTTSALDISDVRIENSVNISQVETDPVNSLTVGPDAEEDLAISFLVENSGAFSFDLVLDHNGSNSSPYRVTFQGSGVMTNNPIKFVVPTPPSPGSVLIGNSYLLRVEVGIDAPDQGALQISLVDNKTGTVSVQECQTLEDNLNQARVFNPAWTNENPGTIEYTLWARYRAKGDCPIDDSQGSDLSQLYQVNWQEDSPTLEIQHLDGVVIPVGGGDDLGQKEFYQEVELEYILYNTSTTTSMHVVGINPVNQVNLDQVTRTSSDGFDLGPEEQKVITVSFLVNKVGPFTFDLSIEHDAANTSPYHVAVTGSGVMSENPIRSLSVSPNSPGSAMVTETFNMEVQAEIDPPAAGALSVILSRQDSGAVLGDACFSILGEHSFLDIDLSWEESLPGDKMYNIQTQYKAFGTCPIEGPPDAEFTESYQVNWQIHEPVLVVNRPEGVTIFDGAVDYVGEHDFFRFVEVTYVIDNESEAGPLVINAILPENLVNLREVIVDPAGPIEIAPGESQTIKISFQILMLEPFSFDLVWDHNGSNPSPYVTGIQGDAKLNLGDAPVTSWLYRFLEALIKSGFFLKLPIFGLIILGWNKKSLKGSKL